MEEFEKRQIFPEPRETFRFQLQSLDEIKDSCLFIIDTNVLLTPMTTGTKSLEAIRGIYLRLCKENRLFIPAQSIREFLDNRATKLADIHETLSKKMNQNFNYVGHHPLLAELPSFKHLAEKEKCLKQSIIEYRSEINSVLTTVKSWGWNDPVSKMYQEVLPECVLSDTELDYQEIQKDQARRLKLKIPPGYKDQSKEFNSEGDLIIWHEILNVGKNKKRDVVFISGDEKADWWHKSGKEPLYPRFELVDEFRRVSEGKTFHIISLSRLLEMYGTDTDVIEEVQREERTIAKETAQSQLSNSSLIEKAMGIVSTLKQFLNEVGQEREKIRNRRRFEMINSTSDEEKHAIWSELNKLEYQLTQRLMARYEQNVKIEAILIRDELLKRLPDGIDEWREGYVAYMYENPTNPLGVESVANDLEFLAKALRL